MMWPSQNFLLYNAVAQGRFCAPGADENVASVLTATITVNYFFAAFIINLKGSIAYNY